MNGKARILLVDDEPKVINALKRVLTCPEYILLSTTDSEEALKIIRNNYLDIIICDQHMPNIAGIDVLKCAKHYVPEAIRILITGSSDINVAISAINEGSIFYFFSKPWNNEEIKRVVQQALDLSREQQAEKGQLQVFKDSQENLEKVSGELKSLNGLLKLINNECQSNEQKGQAQKRIYVYEDEQIILLDTADILYLEATAGDVIICTRSGHYKSTDSLSFWEKKLDRTVFFRCHRSYIVNVDNIEKISPWFNGTFNLKLKDLKENIPVSRSSTKKLKKLFGL